MEWPPYYIKHTVMLSTTEIKQKLKMAFWDYNYSADDLYNVLYHDAQIDYLSKARIYQRLMETYSWYQLLEIIPLKTLSSLLNSDMIKRLRNKALQERYFHVARILRETTLPITG